MELKTLNEKNNMIKIMVGMWIGGNYLPHLQLITPADATDPDISDVLSKIKATYHEGISKSGAVTLDLQNKLLTELAAAGYDQTEMLSLKDNALGHDTEYMTTVAKILEHKRKRLLSEIDWKRKDAEAQAKSIMDTYSIEGAGELHEPAYGAVESLLSQCRHMCTTEAISAGTQALTAATGGLRPGQLVLVGARPGVGKSAYCLQIAEEAAKAGHKVLHIPLEMTAEEMVARMIYRHTKGAISVDTLDSMDMTEEEEAELKRATEEINKIIKTNLIFIPDERELTAIRRQIELYHPDVVVIDQLTLVRDSTHSFDSVRLQYKHIVEELKVMAMDYECVIVLAAQINRQGGNGESRPSMANFKESGSLEESADVCFIIHKEDDDELGKDAATMSVSVDKFRRKQAGYIVYMTYDYNSQIFRDTPGKRMQELIDTTPEAKAEATAADIFKETITQTSFEDDDIVF